MLNVVGPLGRGFSFDPRWRRVLVLARGVGMATNGADRSAGTDGRYPRHRHTFGAHPRRCHAGEFVQGSDVETHAVVDSDGSSALEQVEPLLRRLIVRGARKCSTPAALRGCSAGRSGSAANWACAAKWRLEQQMACAFGVCLCCVREFEVAGRHEHRRVCCEGPVFDLQHVVADSPW